MFHWVSSVVLLSQFQCSPVILSVIVMLSAALCYCKSVCFMLCCIWLVMLAIVMMSAALCYCYTECRYAVCILYLLAVSTDLRTYSLLAVVK